MNDYFGGYLDGIKGRNKRSGMDAPYKAGLKDGKQDRKDGHGLTKDNQREEI